MSPNFRNLAAYATGSVASFGGQDQLQTFVHELSHIGLGTADETLANGATAYGGTAARTLASERTDKAKRNAENWGMFVEEFR